MTTTPAAAASQSQAGCLQPNIASSRSQQANAAASSGSSHATKTPQASAGSGQQQAPSYLFIGSSAAFQQVKQTQASLARLSRVHSNNQQQQQQQQQQQPSQTIQSSQLLKQAPIQQQQQQTKSTTFVDCLIRRFKDCFSEDFCTVPMFVVGNLSPGSDGTHLILPPCVSLGRQNINRFASPKNKRLMGSIRESCRSIEELDLGGNKLNDLIEVYKILQCTPNLKFLNLSENDLSRSSPVAMAATCSFSSSSSSSHYSSIQNVAGSPPSGGWSAGQLSLNSSNNSNRTCLAPINQNQEQQQAIGARRHSTLGQPASQAHPVAASNASSRLNRPTSGRLAETRRLAATAAALAQSKKTSSSVANKLASSAAAVAAHSRSSLTRQPATSGPCGGGQSPGSGNGDSSTSLKDNVASKAVGHHHHQRHQAATVSTMHLARSLSSLSAKDVRGAASSSLSRHRLPMGGARKASSLRGPGPAAPVADSQTCRLAKSPGQPGHLSGSRSSHSVGELSADSGTGAATSRSNKLVVGAHNKMTTKSLPGKPIFVEPIDESDDIDMGEQTASTGSGSNDQQETAGLQAQVAAASVAAPPSQQQHQTRALALQTGTAAATTTATIQMPKPVSQGATSGSSFYQQGGNFRRTFGSIKALAMNNTGCPWRVVCSILNRMPNLEELHLSLNNYERIDLDPNEGFRYPSLKRLYLCNNPNLRNWEELDKLLLAFPSLEALSIADCNISQIPDNLDRAREWQKLCGLNINGWPIKEWPVIERLNQLPSLIDLKCRNLEILNTIDEPRDHLIARLPKLQRLNGSEIEEREYAEKAFLRFFMANSHLERPTRFHELVQIHGEVMWPVDVDVDLSPPSQAQVRVVHLNRNHYRKENEDDILMSEDFLMKLMDNVCEGTTLSPLQNSHLADSSMDFVVGDDTTTTTSSDPNKPVRLFKDEGQEVLAIEVDLRQSVRKFKSTLASLFGLQSQNIILYYIDHEMVGLMGPEVIKHNQKKLWNYNVQDGDQFIVEER